MGECILVGGARDVCDDGVRVVGMVGGGCSLAGRGGCRWVLLVSRVLAGSVRRFAVFAV